MAIYGDLDSRDIMGDFLRGQKLANERNWTDLVAMRTTSDREVEENKWIGSVPTMREWIGGRQERNLALFNLAIRNKPFEATMAILKEDLRRDKTGTLAARAQALGERFETFPNLHISTLITNGEAGTSGLAYDGQFYFDTDHNESGTNQTNDLTATEIPAANVSNPDAPTAVEAADILTQVTGQFQAYTDDQGEPINQGTSSILVMVGNPIYAAAFQTAVGANNLNQGVTNPVAGLRSMGMGYQVVMNPRLSATADKVYFFRSDSVLKPFIIQEEQGLEEEMLGAGSTESFKNRRYLWGVSWWGGFGYGFWQHGILLTLS